MTLIQLEYIVAVDKFRHFGKAAESCFVTQPTLSMQIHKLEEQLGISIFDRTKTPVAPTEAGARIIDQAKITLMESKKIGEMVAQEKGIIAGKLQVGIIPTLSPYLVPLFSQVFLEKYPDVELEIEELVTGDLIRRLKEESLDIGLLVTPFEDRDLRVRPIFYEEFIAYVSHRSKLFQKEELQGTDLKTPELLLLNEGHCFREQVLNICQHYQNRESRFRYESGSLEALKRMVDKNGGLTLLPALATLDMDSNAKQHLRHFTDPKPIREVSLVTHGNFLRMKLARALYETIYKVIPDYLNITKNGKLIRWK